MARQLNIGIACFATYGGSGVIATELGREMAKAGHKVHFISNQLPFRLVNAEFIENIYFHETNSIAYDAIPAATYGFDMASKIIQIATDEKLDILHAHYAVPHAISGIMAKEVLKTSPLKIITTLHGTDITLVGRNPAFYPLTKWAIENSDAVTTVSNWLKTKTYEEFQVDKDIHVIHNFVDTTRFAMVEGKCRKVHFAPSGEKVVLHVSNFRPVKRLEDVVKAFSLIQEKIPSKLLLVGDGPDRDRAVDLVRKLNISEHVYFLGKQNQIEYYYSIADALLFPSEYESFGVTALEAMSAHVPVVATEGSGLSEVVHDGVTGYLLPVGDVRGLADATIKILSDPQLALEMGKRGREIAETYFQASNIKEEYLRLYHSVVEGNEFKAVPYDHAYVHQ